MKEGDLRFRDGISGDARRNRLTAPWIHNFHLRLVEMIAMQSYNRFGRLRVQKILLTHFNNIMTLKLEAYIIKKILAHTTNRTVAEIMIGHQK